MSEWISVKESLPIDPKKNGEESEDVLVTDGKSICVGYYETEYYIENDLEAFEGQKEIYSSDMWHADRDYIAENITHWMPLPKPPEG